MADDDNVNPKLRENTVQHLDVDPNDPRRVPPAETGFSLNEDDPEKEPKPQNPVQQAVTQGSREVAETQPLCYVKGKVSNKYAKKQRLVQSRTVLRAG